MKTATHYIEYFFQLQKPNIEKIEILLAELSLFEFESFQDEENSLRAYIKENLITPELGQFIAKLPAEIQVTKTRIKQVNWNEEWEKNFHPMAIDNCLVRATFHNPAPEFTYEIVIDPKMAFGTGHHATTYMMVHLLLKQNMTGKRVLDMGCGTGILAILAEKLGANEVTAIDVDEWAYHNARENCSLNHCQKVTVLQGDASILQNNRYDLILANINKNILIHDIPIYAHALDSPGILIISGITDEDRKELNTIASKRKLMYKNHVEKDNWIAIIYENNSTTKKFGADAITGQDSMSHSN